MSSEQRRSSGALVFHRSTNQPPASIEVDWDDVERNLNDIDGAFGNPNFDPLRHVLGLLAAVTADKRLEELREQWLVVDSLVDTVVDTHHSGFNKSLQNYSRILKLFEESTSHLSMLRSSLESAATRFRPHTGRLRDLYRRDLMLEDTLRLLEDVESVVSVAATVEQLQEAKHWALAVSTLLDGCNRAAREELAGVEALRHVRITLVERRAALLRALTAELEIKTFETAPSVAVQREAHAVAGSELFAERETALLSTYSISSPRRGVSPTSTSPTGAATLPAMQPEPGSASGGSLAFPGKASGGLTVQVERPPRITHKRSKSYATGAHSEGGHLVRSEAAVNGIVNCIAQLAGTNEVLVAIRAKMPMRIRDCIMFALKDLAADHHGVPSIISGNEHAVRHARARSLFDAVVSKCLGTLQASIRMVQLLTLARPPAVSAGLQQILERHSESAFNTNNAWSFGGALNTASAMPPAPPVASREESDRLSEECHYVWSCLQTECEAFLAAAFGRLAPVHRARISSVSEAAGSGWLAAVREIEAEDSEGDAPDDATTLPHFDKGGGNTGALEASSRTSVGVLTFSMAEEVGQASPATINAGLIPRNDLATTDTGSSTSKTSASYEALLSHALGGHSGSSDLVAAAYMPVMRLVEAAVSLLAETEGSVKAGSAGGSIGSNRLSALIQAPWRAAFTGSPRSPSMPSHDRYNVPDAVETTRLVMFLDSFLRMEFLPFIAESSRARCRSLLDAPDALKPRSRLRGPYVPGAAALPASTPVVQLAEELLDYADKIPAFAPNVAGLLDNVLDRVLAAFHSAWETTAGQSIVGRLADSVEIVQVMAQEPCAPLLGSSVAFFVGSSEDAMNTLVSSAIAAAFGSQTSVGGKELLKRLITERPIAAEALLAPYGDVTKLLFLASLAESADVIADAMAAAASASAFGASVKPTSSSPDSRNTPRRADAWKRAFSGLWRVGSRSELDRSYAEGLAHAADRCRTLAGRCLRALRLEVLLSAVRAFERLPRLCHSDSAVATEAEEAIGACFRTIAQMDEALVPYLTLERREYVFGDVSSTAAQCAVDALTQIERMNSGCAVRICSMLSGLQATLGGTPKGMELSKQSLEEAKLYYSLLTQSADTVVFAAEQNPFAFARDEWNALLSVEVMGRSVNVEQRQRLQKALTAADKSNILPESNSKRSGRS